MSKSFPETAEDSERLDGILAKWHYERVIEVDEMDWLMEKLNHQQETCGTER